MQILIDVLLVLFAALMAWLVFDTRRALRFLTQRLTPRYWPRKLVINPERKFWIWFYRVDAAVVLVGILYLLVTGWRFPS